MAEPFLIGDTMTGGYGSSDILHACTIAVEKGEIAVIVGPNGAGKSTAMKAIFGMLSLRGGSVRLKGEDITKLSPQDRVSKGMGFVPQTHNIFTSMTVEENLEMGAFLRRDDISGTLNQVYDLFPILRQKRYQPAGELSGGQRQRVAVARALILEPQILLLDEPTSALDASIQAEVLNLLDRLRAERGLTYVLVSHDLSVVAHMCERVMVMQHGLVVEELTRQDLQARRATKVYTKALLAATLGYRADEKEKPQ